MNRTLLLAVWISVISGVQSFTIPNITMSWTKANGSCVLATPDINFSIEGMSVDIGPTKITDNDKYWLGYTYRNQLFLYLGCSREKDVVEHSVRHFNISRSPGLCYSACQTDLFGIQDSKCYCYESSSVPASGTLQDCVVTCTEPHSQIQCGGVNSVSLFRFADIPLKSITGELQRTCVAFQPQNGSFVFEDCDEKLHAMCQTTNIRKETVKVSDEKHQWGYSCNFCFKKHKFPLRETFDYGETDHAVWTGMFLSGSVIQKFAEHGTPVQYGRIIQYEETTNLMFRLAQLNETFKALCTDPETSSTTDTPSSDNQTIESAPFQKDDKMLKLEHDGDRNMVNTILYICIPGIIVAIIIAVVVIVCYKKRAKKKTCRQEPTLSGGYSEVKDARDESGYTYNVPFDTLETIPREQNSPDDYDAYDVTNDAGKAINDRNNTGESENVYNKLNTETDCAYDHTDFKQISGSFKSGKNMTSHDGVTCNTSYNRDYSYDTCNARRSGNEATDNVYSHAGSGETYSQVGGKTNNKSSTTNNIYD